MVSWKENPKITLACADEESPMQEKQTFALQTLVATLVLNAILLATIYLLAGEALQNQWLVIVGIGVGITLVLWFIIQFVGNRLIERAATTTAAPAAPPSREERPPQPAPVTTPAPPAEPAPPPETGALQILSILQRQGRLIDFLQEDLALYEDAQIGAAVRSIHEGCKQALADHVKLEPIFKEIEGATVTIPPGFDSRQVRLTGNVAGSPPFKGELRHRGWRITQIDLPAQMHRLDEERILAAAEVEIT
jgi:hypothetical protein